MLKTEYKLGGYTYDAEILRKRMVSYLTKPEAKIKKQEWYAKNKEKMKLWQKEYRTNKLIMAEKYGLCKTCFKRPKIINRYNCDVCANKQTQQRMKQRINKGENKNESKTEGRN